MKYRAIYSYHTMQSVNGSHRALYHYERPEPERPAGATICGTRLRRFNVADHEPALLETCRGCIKAAARIAERNLVARHHPGERATADRK